MFVGRMRMGHTSDFIDLRNNVLLEVFMDKNVISRACNQEHIISCLLAFSRKIGDGHLCQLPKNS
jgi:hypothetical protein